MMAINLKSRQSQSSNVPISSLGYSSCDQTLQTQVCSSRPRYPHPHPRPQTRSNPRARVHSSASKVFPSSIKSLTTLTMSAAAAAGSNSTLVWVSQQALRHPNSNSTSTVNWVEGKARRYGRAVMSVSQKSSGVHPSRLRVRNRVAQQLCL